MMPDIRRSSAQATESRLFALAGSFVIHGLAVAAIIAVADGKPEAPIAPAAFTVVMAWSMPSGDAPSRTDSGSTAPSLPSREEESASADIMPAAWDMAPHPPDPPPMRKSAAAAKPKAAPQERAVADGNPPAPPAIEQPTGAAAAAAPDAAASSTFDAGGRAAWSVTSRTTPDYPMGARRRGIEGDVSLRVDIGADGRPWMVTVRRSSGDPRLDAAAARAVEQWRFTVAAPVTIDIPIMFRLNTSTAEATQP